MIKICLVCGGPSKERDISLNSVRSIYDHLTSIPKLEVNVIFLDEKLDAYIINEQFLYSNTISDFSHMLSFEKSISKEEYLALLKAHDLVFPVMHGLYGEDGQFQSFLENNHIPYVGSSSVACRKMYNKKNADVEILRKNNMVTIPKLFLSNKIDLGVKMKDFLEAYKLEKVVLKPIQGGSSIGVTYAEGFKKAVEVAENLLDVYGDIVVEQQCIGTEFTIIILEHNQKPIPLIPTEIELLNKDGKPVKGEIFSKRKKYLSTTETHYYCPPRFDIGLIEKIREDAKFLFSFTEANDFLRIDGWVLEDGSVYFSDFNPISGMEQNSFIFQQSAKIGFRHNDLLEYILTNACSRYHIDFSINKEIKTAKQKVNVLLGGITSERQVSLMSGTNVWLKLQNSSKYETTPYILLQDEKGFFVYEVPYAIALNHTTEEIYDQILNMNRNTARTVLDKLKISIKQELEAETLARYQEPPVYRMNLSEFVELTKSQSAYVFIALHGGFGENGSLQKELEMANVKFNGSSSKVSELCMDKYRTGKVVENMKDAIIRTCKKKKYSIKNLLALDTCVAKVWDEITDALGTKRVVIKPNADGCSTGIVILQNVEDLSRYLQLQKENSFTIPKNTFTDQTEVVQIPKNSKEFLFEEYIETKKLEVSEKKIHIKKDAPWIELTVGVIEKNGYYHSFTPSITVADSAVLSLEEKFQGGTGINLTPPPENILKKEQIQIIKEKMELVAKKFGIKDYCRIDIFVNSKTSEIIVIELNTLPGLSPSTVLFQQAAKEELPIYPIHFLEGIISNACYMK